MRKNSFTLFSTLVLIFIFSILALKIFELKAISSVNIVNQYNYIQAKNHLKFLEEYVNFLDDLESFDKIQIKNEKFEINALINKIENKKYDIELIVKNVNSNIRVYKRIEVIK